MSRVANILLTVLATLMLSPVASAFADAAEAKPQTACTYELPLSLHEIEKEAFSGTAVEIVFFPDGFLKIGEKAFDKAWQLTDVYIPETTEYIADSAFFFTLNLKIHGIDGSYAMDWAYSHEIPFIVDNVWNVIVQCGRTHNTRTDPFNCFIVTLILVILFELFQFRYYEMRSRRPQDRPELNPIDYRFP